ncbi:MAG: helix-turn-helix transcriptional regulator [Actinobacteria bacterium]|nr:helix-turn-helix transcriptional regulator [Actinomycetota bacterium]
MEDTETPMRKESLRLRGSYLFFSCQFAALFLLMRIPSSVQAISLSNPMSDTIFFIAFLVACIVASLCMTLGSINSVRILSNPPLLFSVFLVVAGGTLLGLCQFGITAPNVYFTLSAVLIGFGNTVLLLFWGRAYARLEQRESLLHTAISLGIAAIIGLVISFISLPLERHIVIVLLFLVSALPLERTSLLIPKDEADRQNTPTKLSELFSQTWKTLLGTALCCLIVACPWGTSLALDRFAVSTTVGIEKSIAHMLVALMFTFVIILRYRKNEPTHEYQKYSPLAGAALLLAWFLSLVLSSTGNSSFINSVDIVSGIGSAFFFIALWANLADVSRKSDIDSSIVFGGGVAFLSGVTLLCIPLALVLREATEYVTPAFIVLYLATIGLNVGRSKDKDEPGREATKEAGLGEGVLEKRCVMIGRSYRLSPRESEILPYLAQGHSAAYIAKHLCISFNTVKTHTKRVYEKLGVHSRDNLIALINSMDIPLTQED